MIRTLPLVLALASPLALAAPLPGITDGVGLLQDDGGAAPVDVSTGRNYDMEVNFRGRMMSVPKSILDMAYFGDGESLIVADYERPHLSAYALGLEFVTKGETANGIFYFEYITSLMDGGYWDDREGEGGTGPDYQDGEYLEPTPNLGLVAFGANYAYEAHFVRTEDTNGNFGMSLLVGAGLGVGIMVGQVDYWAFKDGVNALIRHDTGQPSDGAKPGIPPALPMVDINAGLRFNFGDRFVVRVEGGLHTMLYYGAALGIMF